MARTLLIALVVLVGLAASPATGARIDSGIVGHVTIGPSCPVERYPPDPNCGDRPYDARVEIRRRPSLRLVTTVRSGPDGRFVVRLQPGYYELRPLGPPRPGRENAPPAGAIYPTAGRAEIAVHRHRFARVTISYDSGIR